MKCRQLVRILSLIAVFPLLIGLSSAHALEQMSNASFTSTANDWVITEETYGDFSSTADFAQAYDGSTGDTGGSFKVFGQRKKDGNPSISAYAYANMAQTLPLTPPLASEANITIAASHREQAYFTSFAYWELQVTGGLYLVSTNNLCGTSFLDAAHLGSTTSTVDTGWSRTATWRQTLSPGDSYRLQFRWKFGANKAGNNSPGTQLSSWIDRVTANLSPSGLTATEIPSGQVFLDWPASTNPSSAPQLAIATHAYRMYRSTTPLGPWDSGWILASSTSRTTTSWSENPSEDEVYYCITDYDTAGQESPKSPLAVFKRARLEITKVEASQTTVTRGQSGLSVKVYLTNTGFSPASFGGASLTFKLPAVGHYSWSRQSPALGTIIPGGGSLIAEFIVDVLDDSICDIDTIDATASGTNAISGRSIGDAGATLPTSWLIRAPASLRVLSVVTPSTVFLGQTEVPIDVTVENMGDKNAAGLWDSTDLQFDLGTYLNIQPQTPYPLTIYAAQASTVRYLLEVDPTSATGTAKIDAHIGYRDINLQVPTSNFDGALVPGQWTIVAGFVNTYKDAARLIKMRSFNQGYYTVFSKAENLAPLKEHRLRWYNPSGVQVAYSDPAVQTDETGAIEGEFELTPTSPLGIWRVVGTRVFDTVPLCENTFEVVAPASLTLSLSLPTTVSLNSTFIATVSISNVGGAFVQDAEPATATIAAGNTGTATYQTGPAPLRQDISPTGTVTYTYRFQALTTGQFQLLSSGFGFDANATSTPRIIAATQTSNVCTIQTPPVLTVLAVKENYVSVSPGQTDLLVDVGIRNSGQAGAYIDAASLSHTLAGHSHLLTTPSLPYLLPGNTAATLTFLVSVDPAAAPGTNTITGSLAAFDANDPSSRLSATGGTPGTWDVLDYTGVLSPSPSYSPEQYGYTLGQRVYARFDLGAVSGTKMRIFIYDPAGNERAQSATQDSGQYRTFDYLTTTDIVGSWRVELWLVTGGGAKSGTSPVGRLYFDLFHQGRLTGTLTLSPDPVEVGATLTAQLVVSNPVTAGSTIATTTPTLPAKTAPSTGDTIFTDGPDPISGMVTPSTPLTFTWHFLAADDTGTVGSFSMTSSASGFDMNTGEATGTLTILSNSIVITRRALALASATIDFGTMFCNQTKGIGNTRLDNIGNVGLTNVCWQPVHLYCTTNSINRANIGFSPDNGFSVSPSSYRLASLTLTVPFNQASGTYTGVLNVWDDFAPANGARDVAEPFDEFAVTVVIGETELVILNESLIDMGNAPAGSQIATKTFSAFNGGNVKLEKLKFEATPATLTATISFTPSVPGTLATDGILIASISALIDPAAPSGIYIATYTLFEDNDDSGTFTPGEPHDTVQLRFSIGNQSLTIPTNPLDMGNGTPTYTISNVPFTIQNTGSLSLTRLKIFPLDLVRVPLGTIPGENLIPELPSVILPGATVNATMSLYVAAGSPAGVYVGTLRLFEDLDGDGTYVGDPTEATADTPVQVTVNPYQALDVINSTVSLGGRIPGEPGTSTFLCRNVGSVDLTSLTWTKTDLLSPSDSILSSAYDITPTSFFTATPGETFTATLSFTIPNPKTDGDYFGQYGWLFDDTPVNGKDPTDPQDKFTIYCKIGAKSLNIVDLISQIPYAEPYTTTSPVEFTVNNNGILVLARPVATLTRNLDDGSGHAIATSAITLNPIVFSFINPTQNKTGSWRVTIPANLPSGLYTGQLKLWNDENANNAIDLFEASDTCELRVQVAATKKIAVMQNPLDLFFIAAGQAGTGSIEIRNVGNVDLTGITLRALPAVIPPVAPGPSPIPAPMFTITTPPTFLSDGSGSCLATLSVSVPPGQTAMPYQGYQAIYADGNGNGSWDAGEALATFTVKLTVGEKKIGADTPILFGTKAPGSWTLPFNVYNLTSIGISKGRWSILSLVSAGGAILPTSSLSFLPTPFTISPNSSKACTLTLNIPSIQPPGTYIATQTAFEDENLNGFLDGFEASASIRVEVTVDAYPRLQIVPATIAAGSITAGDPSTKVEVLVYNAGNATFSAFAWTTSDLVSGGNPLSSSLLSISGIAPTTLSPGQYGIATVTIGPIDAAQPAGIYTGSQFLYAPAYYPGSPEASDSVLLSITVNPPSTPATGPNVGSGSTYQEVATSTFAATAPNNRFILSAWVCPGTGTAAIGFFQADEAGNKAGYDGAMIDKNGVLTPFGSLVEAGILESKVARHPKFPTPPLRRPLHVVSHLRDLRLHVHRYGLEHDLDRPAKPVADDGLVFGLVRWGAARETRPGRPDASHRVRPEQEDHRPKPGSEHRRRRISLRMVI
ncbi:MAG TPA: hypothetical protein PLP29_02230 [Candidatus Ozemobacteraceae bacterium]|nr:hypothetical protein [Candidatus Ozemobacteraceae bacterium]